MKVIYLVKSQNSVMWKWQTIHIISELRENGLLGEVVDIGDNRWAANLREAIEECSKLKLSHCSIILSFLDDKSMPSEFFDIAKENGIPTVLICFDNLHVPHKHKRIVKFFDLVWLTSHETEWLFRRWGAKKVVCLPYAANPDIVHGSQAVKLVNHVGFLGSLYGSRVNQLSYLKSKSVPLEVITGRRSDLDYIKKGRGMRYFGYLKEVVLHSQTKVGRKLLLGNIRNRRERSRAVDSLENCVTVANTSFNEMYKYFRSWAVTLNITELRNTGILLRPVYKLHLRTFEIPMSYGLQLTAYTEELAQYFKEDKEILFYRNWEEMADKAKFWVDGSKSSAIKKMKQAARERSLKEHTWTHRFHKIFKALDLR